MLRSWVSTGVSSVVKIAESYYVKVTPEDLIEFKGEAATKSASFREIKAFKAAKLSKALTDISSHGIVATSDELLLYRFHTGELGLLSEAQRHGDPQLSKVERASFLDDHAGRNTKIKTIKEKTRHSPYVSTTADLNKLINTTFSIQGDTNIRHDVFERAETISVFRVPRDLCHSASSTIADLSASEREVCYDASERPLLRYLAKQYVNPLKGQIAIDIIKLAVSRRRGDMIAEAMSINSRIKSLITDEDKKIEINDEFIASYSQAYERREAFCREIVDPVLGPGMSASAPATHVMEESTAGVSSFAATGAGLTMASSMARISLDRLRATGFGRDEGVGISSSSAASKKAIREAALPEDKRWWGQDEILAFARSEVGDRGEIRDPVASSEQLTRTLSSLAAGADGTYIIPLNVNVISSEFEERHNNHYTSLVIKKTVAGTTVEYVDPMGRPPGAQLVNKIRESGLAAEVLEPITGKRVQYSDIEGVGVTRVATHNNYDCGPMMGYLSGLVARGEAIPSVTLPAESIALGQCLRQQATKKGIRPAVEIDEGANTMRIALEGAASRREVVMSTAAPVAGYGRGSAGVGVGRRY